MTDDPSDLAPHGTDARAQALDARLKAAKARASGQTAPLDQPASDGGYRAGNRVLADLVGGLTGGLFLGWVIDQFAGTRPWGMVVMLFFGIFVAFRNIIRRSGEAG